MESSLKRSFGPKQLYVCLGFAVLVAALLFVAYAGTASAQGGEEAPVLPPVGPGPTPDKGGDDVSVGLQAQTEAPCRVTSLGVVSASSEGTGSWSSSCLSVNRSGSYARFFSFTLSGQADVTIDLESTDLPEVDTYLFLLNGAGTSGTVVDDDDDSGVVSIFSVIDRDFHGL